MYAFFFFFFFKIINYPKSFYEHMTIKLLACSKWFCISWIMFQEAQAYAEENSLLFMETSAKTAMNVNDIFLAIGE